MPRRSLTERVARRGSRLARAATGAFALLAAASPVLIAAPAHASGAQSRPPIKIYVSPTKGYDNGPGTQDRPFRTLDEARTRVRAINRNMQSDIDVELLGGTYPLSSTLTLTNADSGTNGHRVVYEAASGANPIISGGATVTGWTAADSTGTVYKAHLGVDTRQLYVNGELETRARGADNPAGFTKTATGYTITDTSMDAWQNQSDVEVVSRWGWMEYRCPVQSIVGTTMTMQQPCFHNANLHQGQEIQNPTWMENARELLNTPGEWYLDQPTHELYYLPKAGQNMATAAVTVPRVQDLIDLN
ncbi:MAG: hypothetical protein QOF95_2873, partial [Pseudonocardiales bacterium]|nr:hypothetical protein [Pseudonocardiales bacterium]